MFFIVSCIIVLGTWLIFADKTRWRELIPVSFFAGFVGSLTDTIVCHYRLWDYYDPLIPQPILMLGDDLTIYIVVTYLFIQWLPTKRKFWNMVLYWFMWTAVAITIEWIHIKTGHMDHHLWWSYWHSYVADWLLFFIFYKYHQIFQFEKLSRT